MLFETLFKYLPAITNNQDRYLNIGGTAKVPHSFVNTFFASTQNYSKKTILISLVSLITGIYIILPSITEAFESEEQSRERKKNMFMTKRIDKYSTALRNPRNDCFANSTLQALSSCSSLIIYLNVFNKFHKEFVCFYNDFSFGEDSEDRVKNIENLIPLHHELAIYMFKLNSPVVYSNVISVRPFLKVMEKIFNSKMSSNQHDAHELLQIILQTLENEYLSLIKVVSIYKEKLFLHQKVIEKDLDQLAAEKLKEKIDNFLDKLVIPSFPFYGYGISQFTCLSCLQKSTLSKYAFSILSLPVPQESEVSLLDLFLKNQSETINDYSCMNCKIKSILRIEKQKEAKAALSGNEKIEPSDNDEFIDQLKNMENFCKINDEIEDKDLENFIANYEYEGFKTETLKSTIIKNHYLIKLPSIMAIHLSRSIFENNLSTKNTCRVNFQKKLELAINKKIFNEYKMQENVTKIEGEDSDDELEDGEDGEDEEDEDSSEDEDNADGDGSSTDSDSDSDTDDENSITESIIDEKKFEDQSKEKVDELIDTVKNLNIGVGEAPLPSLNGFKRGPRHRRVKDVVDYKLKSVIKHTGSHYYGHYECYKKKPNYYKKHHQIIHKNPIINLNTLAIDETSNAEKIDDYKELQAKFIEDNERVFFEHYSKDKNNEASLVNNDVVAVDIHGNEWTAENAAPESQNVSSEATKDSSSTESSRKSNENDVDSGLSDLNGASSDNLHGTTSPVPMANVNSDNYDVDDTILENEVSNGNGNGNGNGVGRGRSRTLSLSIKKSLKRFSRNNSNTSLASLRNGNHNSLSPLRNGSHNSLNSLSGSSPGSPVLGHEFESNGNIHGNGHSASAFNINDLLNDGGMNNGVAGTRSRGASFSLSRSSSVKRQPAVEAKLSSVVKRPYWRMSDSDVSEVSDTTVLNDSAAVYMIFYERK